MQRKLNSVLKNLILLSRSERLRGNATGKLFLKAGFYTLSLFWMSQTFSFLAIAVFLAGSLYFYLSPLVLVKNSGTFVAFLFVFLSSFVASLSGLNWFYFLIFGFFYFLILGIKDGVFKNKWIVYQILNNFLLFFAFIIFFLPDQPQWFFWKFAGLAVVVFFLLREFLRNNPFAAVFSLLIVQLAWAVMFLPIGFLNSSALMLVIVLVFKDLIAAYLNKSLNNVLIMKNVTILAVSGLIIFMASHWQP